MRASAIDIRTEGGEEIVKACEKLSGPNMDALLRNAMSKGGTAMKPSVAQQAPSGGPGGSAKNPTHPGDLKRSISMKRGKRSRPPAVIIYPKKTGWYSKWVIAGTKPHALQGNLRHPGSRRNDYMTRGGKAGTPAALAAIGKYVNTYIESLD